MRQMKLIMMGKRTGTVLAVLAGVAVAYFGFLRRWHMTWGATAQEAGGQVAGDELMPDAGIVATRVVEIDAPPAAIWPWLVQMGQGVGAPTPTRGSSAASASTSATPTGSSRNCKTLRSAMRSRCRATPCAWNVLIPGRRW